MLRRIFAIDNFRGLSHELMPDGTVFGKKTVIFGANGSGKSSISEFLRIAASDSGTETTFKSQSKVTDSPPSSLTSGQQFGFADIRVFNHFYVTEYLQSFLDADGHSATIFKLGDNALAATAEASARERLSCYNSRLDAVKSELVDSQERIRSRIQDLKEEVLTALGSIDPVRFSSYRFNVVAARSLLEGPKSDSLSEDELLRKLEAARMTAPKEISVVAERKSPVPVLQEKLKLGLNQTTRAIIIEELAANPSLAAWVESGLKFHEENQTCEFCLNDLSAERMRQLEAHFDESRAQAIQRLTEFSDECASELSDLDKWQDTLPNIELFYPDLRDKASSAQKSMVTWAQEVSIQITMLQNAAKQKISDFYSIVDCPEVEETIDCPIDNLTGIVNEHNERAKGHLNEVESAISDVLGHLASKYYDSYKADSAREPRLEKLANFLSASAKKFERLAEYHKADQTDETFMANQIDADVRIMFGRSDLEITPSIDKKGYIVRRNDEPARFLSEGERKMIALSYFVRSLEADDVDPERMLVVVDDPVSSLDRENMYAAFSWLQTTLESVAQAIILTHDFELLRLFISGTSSQRSDSKKKIKAGNKDEEWFPKVSFLEVSRNGNSQYPAKQIQLRNFPDFLLDHDSEYHYLFHKVITTAGPNGEDSLLPLVGNASRRLLEGFVSFEAPGGTSFQQKLDMACQGKVDDASKNRVIKFAHGQSHRDNPNPTTGVDLPTVRTELQALLDLISACHPTHFERMCKATKTKRDWSAHIHPITT